MEKPLPACPSTPNCVCSCSPPADATHAIAALPWRPKSQVRDLLLSWPRVALVQETEDRLDLVFTTRWLRFKDDVSLFWNAAELRIEVRSASRLGRRDFGTNRNRIERIRQALDSL